MIIFVSCEDDIEELSAAMLMISPVYPNYEIKLRRTYVMGISLLRRLRTDSRFTVGIKR